MLGGVNHRSEVTESPIEIQLRALRTTLGDDLVQDLEGRPFGAVEEARVRGLGSPRHPTSRPYGTGSDHSVALVYRRLETNWWAVRVAQDAF